MAKYNAKVCNLLIGSDRDTFINTDNEEEFNKEPLYWFFRYVMVGLPLDKSAGLVGLGESTIHEWKQEDGPRFKSKFSKAYKKAMSYNELDHVKNIRKAGKRSWQASAWWLERTNPDTYKEQKSIEHDGNIAFQGAIIQHDIIEDGKEQKKTPNKRTAITETVGSNPKT